MEDKKMMKECGECCSAHQCGCGGFHASCGMGHWGIRLFLGLVILGFVFWGGVKLGELKASLYGDYGNQGYGMMGGRFFRSGMMGSGFFGEDGYGPGYMMGGYYAPAAQPSTTKPATPAK